MNDVGEVCSICFDIFEDPVMLPCGHKLCMKCAQSMSTSIIEKENKFYGNPYLSIDITEYGITCPYRCSTAPYNEIRRSSYDYLAMYSPDICLRSFIICFLIDGSHKYMEMTLRAINSLMISTPVVFVGILVPPLYNTSDLFSRVVDPTRVIFKEYRTHFDKWNPTQHKLDIAQFATEFSIIFWLDSDTYVYKDLTPLLMEFRFSKAKFAFVADHVCTNQEFLGNWKNKKSPLIPQACFMGFRKEYIHSFFNLWEEMWRSWIEPAPFHNHPDPLPSFAGSSFCIEQYALGMTIEKFGLSSQDIFELRRVCIPLCGDSSPSHVSSSSTSNSFPSSTYAKSFSTPASANTSPSYTDLSSLSSSSSSFFNSQGTPITSPTLGSLSFLSPPPRSKKQKRGGKKGNGKTTTNTNTEGGGEKPEKEINLNFPNYTFSNLNNEYSNRLLDTPTMVAAMEQAFMAHLSSYNSSKGFNRSSYSFSSSNPSNAFWIDDIEGYILHFYSMNYDITFDWFTNHKHMIMSRTEEYWTPKYIPPLEL